MRNLKLTMPDKLLGAIETVEMDAGKFDIHMERAEDHAGVWGKDHLLFILHKDHTGEYDSYDDRFTLIWKHKKHPDGFTLYTGGRESFEFLPMRLVRIVEAASMIILLQQELRRTERKISRDQSQLTACQLNRGEKNRIPGDALHHAKHFQARIDAHYRHADDVHYSIMLARQTGVLPKKDGRI